MKGDLPESSLSQELVCSPHLTVNQSYLGDTEEFDVESGACSR